MPWCSLKYTLHPSCHHLPLEAVITKRNPNNPVYSPKEDLFPDLTAFCFLRRKLWVFYVFQATRGLLINPKARNSTLLKTLSGWTWPSFLDWPQFPLSRFPVFPKIQVLAIPNKWSVTLSIQVDLYILSTIMTMDTLRCTSRVFTPPVWSDKRGQCSDPSVQ